MGSERTLIEGRSSIATLSYGQMAECYFQSVSVAALCFAIWYAFFGTRMFAELIAKQHSVLAFGVELVAVLTVAWLVAVMLSAAPCLVLAWTAKRMQVKAPTFYPCAGIVVGLLAVVAWVKLGSSISFYTDSPDKVPLDLSRGFEIFWGPLGFAGGIAGIMFWQLASRRTLES